MKYIEFGILRIFLLFPLLHPIFCFIKSIIEKKLEKETKDKLQDYLAFFIFEHAGFILQIIPEIISRIRQKRTNLDIIERSIDTQKFIFSNLNFFDFKVIGLILITNILESYPEMICISIVTNSSFYFYLARFFLLFFTAIESFFILDIVIFKHQYLGMIIIFISTFFIIIISNCYIEFNFISTVGEIFILFSSSLALVINKMILEFYFISPFMILFVQGISGLIIDSILLIIFIMINLFSINDFFDFFFNEINLFMFISYSILYSLTNMFILLTTFYFSPTMVMVSDFISAFALDIMEKLEWYKIVSYIILIFGCLIYNEIIILKFCELQKFTQKEIILRGQIDIKNEDDSSSEDNNIL